MADKVSIYDENGELAEGVERIRTQCYFCHANCGVLAYVKDGDVIKIEGDPDYNNQGGLCCRGTSALLHVNHPARINHALKRAGEAEIALRRRARTSGSRSRTIRRSKRSPSDSTRSRPSRALRRLPPLAARPVPMTGRVVAS